MAYQNKRQDLSERSYATRARNARCRRANSTPIAGNREQDFGDCTNISSSALSAKTTKKKRHCRVVRGLTSVPGGLTKNYGTDVERYRPHTRTSDILDIREQIKNSHKHICNQVPLFPRNEFERWDAFLQALYQATTIYACQHGPRS